MNSPDVIERLAERYRGRAQQCETTAKIYLAIIIGVLSACILIFAGADRLASALFKSETDREVDALLNQAKLELVRKMPGLMGQMLTPMKSTVPEPVAGNAGTPASPPTRRWPAEPAPVATTAVPIERLAINPRSFDQELALREAIKQLYEDNTALHQELVEARENAELESDRQAIAETHSGVLIDIAQELADMARTVAEEETARAENLNALISSSVARIGAVVIAIMLVRIFMRDRLRLTTLAGFYLGLADAIEISRGDPALLREWLPQLAPPLSAALGDELTPIESVLQVLVELAKRERG